MTKQAQIQRFELEVGVEHAVASLREIVRAVNLDHERVELSIEARAVALPRRAEIPSYRSEATGAAAQTFVVRAHCSDAHVPSYAVRGRVDGDASRCVVVVHQTGVVKPRSWSLSTLFATLVLAGAIGSAYGFSFLLDLLWTYPPGSLWFNVLLFVLAGYIVGGVAIFGLVYSYDYLDEIWTEERTALPVGAARPAEVVTRAIAELAGARAVTRALRASG